MDRLVIRILETGDEAALELFLTPRIDSSMFLLGNMRIAGFVDDGEAYQAGQSRSNSKWSYSRI